MPLGETQPARPKPISVGEMFSEFAMGFANFLLLRSGLFLKIKGLLNRVFRFD
jgi:hypothetical protein